MVKIVILRDSHLFAPALNAVLSSLPIDHRALTVDWFFFGLILDPRCEASYTTYTNTWNEPVVVGL